MANPASSAITCVLIFTCLVLVTPRASPEWFDNEFLPDDHALRQHRQDWGYVTVRPQAHMFWWLYYTTHAQGHAQKPLVMWFQGGPGASSTGVGNFQIMGPLDPHLRPRNTSWLQEASLLFVDQPVGTGFSYVDDDSAYTTDGETIAQDLVALMKDFLQQQPDFKRAPFYIFGQSYGGKMAVLFAKALHKAISDGEVECNLAGVAMGNAWISPIDSTMTWAGTLHWASVVDEVGYSAILSAASQVKSAHEDEDVADEEAMERWFYAQKVVHKMASGVDFYNIDIFSPSKSTRRAVQGDDSAEGMFPVIPGGPDDEVLDALMNTEVRQHLGIIPKDLEWDLISWKVFRKQYGDFLNPVVDLVGELLETTNIDVIVYQGQRDLICDTKGAMEWVQKMPWSGLQAYNNHTRTAMLNPVTRKPEAFRKNYRNFSFYWILDAGHAVPADQGDAALRMLRRIFQRA